MHHSSRILLLVLLGTTLPAAAQHAASHALSPYSGEQKRAIASLSEEDLKELAQGGGWGLARVAELNGAPGPVHLLELADEIGLSADQRAPIEVIRDEMRADAITAGERFIAAERALDAAFTEDVPDVEKLARLTKEAENARADLRFIHLSAHLRTTPFLTPDQIKRYAILRGYADDPCESVPEGHDATMWRRHNGCS